MEGGHIVDIAMRTFNDFIRLSVFSSFKTNNILLDTLISTILLTVNSFLVRKMFFIDISNYNYYSILDWIKSRFYKRYAITFEGKHTFILSKFQVTPHISSCFTESFKALLHDIISNISNFENLYEIQEYITSKKWTDNIESDMYIITQTTPFLYNKELDIYARTSITQDEVESEKKSAGTKTVTITVVLYSYKTNIRDIQKFVNVKKNEYLEFIEKTRNKKQYI